MGCVSSKEASTWPAATKGALPSPVPLSPAWVATFEAMLRSTLSVQTCCVSLHGQQFASWVQQHSPTATLLVEDCRLDARFKADPKVVAQGLRFFCGVPLVGRSGASYGALCITDDKPRSLSKEHLDLVHKMAGIVVSELEPPPGESKPGSLHCGLLCDAGLAGAVAPSTKGAAAAPARVLTGPQALAAGGGPKSLTLEGGGSSFGGGSFGGGSFSEFGSPRIPSIRCDSRPLPLSQLSQLRCHSHSLSRTTPLRSGSITVQRSPSGSIQGASGFALAAGDQASLRGALGGLGFGGPRLSVASVGGSPPGSPRAVAKLFSDVQLGELLGKGGYGRVYKASWRGAQVAVKVRDVYLHPLSSEGDEKELLEALLGKEAAHPHLVSTFDWGVRPVGGVEPQGDGPQRYQLWIIQEFFDRGSLYDKIEGGRFRTRGGSVCLLHVLYTAQEIAGALSYLHDRGIHHRDLTASNVLVRASGKDTRRFTAAVGDFGLSRVAAPDVATTRFGTVSHMPPELLKGGAVDASTDVYSFGTLLWEMYCSKHPFQGMHPAAVVNQVTCAERCPLVLPPDAPPQLAELFAACVDYNPAKRPSFDEILVSLVAMIEQAQCMAPPSPVPPSPPGPTV